MVRYMRQDSDKLFRVVVVEDYGRGPIKTIYGPYGRKNTAGFVKSYMATDWRGRPLERVKDSWIEVAEPEWTKDD